jgi:hypothetical protein
MNRRSAVERVGCVRVLEPVSRGVRVNPGADGGIFHNSKDARAAEGLCRDDKCRVAVTDRGTAEVKVDRLGTQYR